MILVTAGIAGAGAAAGMAGMGDPATGTSTNAVLNLLLRAGPVLLIISATLVAVALGLRRPWLVVPAAAAGAVMYWGMYLQDNLPVMYTSSALGLPTWLALLLTTRHSHRHPPRRRRTAITPL